MSVVAEAIGDGVLPGRVWMYSNYHCNLACAYCLTESSPHAERRELAAERMLEIAVEARELGFTDLGVTGGEPFMLPWLPETLAELAAILPLVVLSNATLFTPARIERLAPLAGLPAAIQVSLDHADPEPNDALRAEHNFAAVVEAIPRLVERGLRVRIASTIDPDQPGSDEDRSRLCELHRRLGVPDENHVVRPIVRRGRARIGGLGVDALPATCHPSSRSPPMAPSGARSRRRCRAASWTSTSSSPAPPVRWRLRRRRCCASSRAAPLAPTPSWASGERDVQRARSGPPERNPMTTVATQDEVLDPGLARTVARGLAVIRILMGLTYLSNGLAKLFGLHEIHIGWYHANLINRDDARFILDAEINHNARSQVWLVGRITNDLVLPHWNIFQWGLTVVEIAAGVLLVLGLWSRLGALLALAPAVFLFFVYFANDRWLPEQPLEVVPLIVLAVVPSGRVWGLDGRFGRRHWPS